MGKTTLIDHPLESEIEQVFSLITRADIEEYGEPDSELSDLRHEWGRMDLSHDAWVARDDKGKIMGYAAVMPSAGEMRIDVYLDTDRAMDDLGQALLSRCEERMAAISRFDPISAHTYLAHVNRRDRHMFTAAGFAYVKSYYQMHIDLTRPLVAPEWPEGIQARTAIRDEDDEAIYQAVQLAFEREIGVEPTYQQWREHMIRSEVYDPDLWIIALAGDQIVGTCLGIKYESEGWIRQFGVVPAYRKRGIATALLRQAFVDFRDRGYERAGLGMEADNQGARRLYERIGMRVLRQYDEYSKLYGGQIKSSE